MGVDHIFDVHPPVEHLACLNIGDFVVGADGAFANVLVNVDGSFPNTAVPTTPVVLNQKDCMYVPRVLGARTGQTLQVTNEDPTDHNVHSLSKAGNGFRVFDRIAMSP